MAARLSYTIATEGELPAFLERKVWRQPVVGLLITAVLALLMANFLDLGSISVMGSAGFLIIFAIVNAANFVLSEKIGSRRLIAAVGIMACIGALAVLIGYALMNEPKDILVLLAMIILALLIEGAYLRFWKKKDNKKRVSSQGS